jgi:stearoyl-CoA desaturase (delta-9 desaturase)
LNDALQMINFISSLIGVGNYNNCRGPFCFSPRRGMPWLVWGIAVRVAVSVTGHWLVGYFAHNRGPRSWHINGAGVQGYNIPGCGLITMGEAWHNNHHAFPGSARLGIKEGEWDPGWCVLIVLYHVGLVWGVKTPDQLPHRPNLVAVGERY